MAYIPDHLKEGKKRNIDILAVTAFSTVYEKQEAISSHPKSAKNNYPQASPEDKNCSGDYTP
jgi:hypothetical protein